jgi:hypothetical protein
MSDLPPSTGGAAPTAAAAAAPDAAAPAPNNNNQQQPQRLWLAVHTVENVSARVPFSIILLMDAAKRRAIPDGVGRVRMIIPSDGRESVSLWDAAAAAPLQAWLSSNLGPDAIVQVYGVEEDFCVGVSLELARARAAERTQRAAERAGAAVAQRVQELDRSTGLVAGARETTQAAAARVSALVSKAAEDERVQRAAASVSGAAATAWTRLAGWVAAGQSAAAAHGGFGGAGPGGGAGGGGAGGGGAGGRAGGAAYDPFAAAGGAAAGGAAGGAAAAAPGGLDPLDTPPAPGA